MSSDAILLHVPHLCGRRDGNKYLMKIGDLAKRSGLSAHKLDD